MKALMTEWRMYLTEQQEASILIEEICAGKFIKPSRPGSVITEIALEEGIAQFFNDAYSSIKQQVHNFTAWKDEKLMAFIDGTIEKIQDFFAAGRQKAINARGMVRTVLIGLFPKYQSRKLIGLFGVFRKTEYLKAGAAILSILLQKLVMMGFGQVAGIIAALPSGTADLTQGAIDKLKEVGAKIKEIIAAVNGALDPSGILDLIIELPAWSDRLDLIKQLANDLKSVQKLNIG
jgi:hypothetical protein